MAETDKPEAVDESMVFYLVRSVIRDRSNRTARAAQAGRRAFVQRFAGGTILVRRARPARLSEAVLKANLEELKKAVAEHRILVTTLSGQPVDLNTFQAAPPAAVPPLPNPPLDSAKNDQNQGIGYDIPPTPEGTGANAPTPELLQQRIPEGTEPPPPLPNDPDLEFPPTSPVPSGLEQGHGAEQHSSRKHHGKKRGER